MLTIHQIRKNSHAVQLLGEYFDFEVWSESEIDLPDWLNLSTKEKFIPFASEGAGGVFLVGNSTQRVMYVTSEGSAGCIAATLSDLIQLLSAYPYWQDLLKFSGGGQLAEMKRVPSYSEESLKEEYPDINKWRAELLEQFGLSEACDAIEKLHNAICNNGYDFDVIAGDGYTYDDLFNKFVVDDNPMWSGT